MDRDTICAPASAPVQSALAVIRISGKHALHKATQIFSFPGKISPRRSVYGWIYEGTTRIDDVLLTFFPAPHSFTGEDTVEISCHGNPLVVQNIVSLIQRDGTVRMAQPGEFTRRAFENGKMDLTAAEAVNAIIRARSGWEIDTALRQMHGSLKTEIDGIRDNLISLKADVEAAIDFSHEDMTFVSHEDLMSAAKTIQQQLTTLLQRCKIGEKIVQGLNIAIVGKPNAGKSSILNYIVNEERAIVSEIPGTTRDLVRETIQINGLHINLIDTAGIRQSEDSVERIGIERSKEAIAKAHIVLAVFDCTTGITQEDLEIIHILPAEHTICILNKCDVQKTMPPANSEMLPGRRIPFSAMTGYGFSELEESISTMMETDIKDPEHSFLADARIISILERSIDLGRELNRSVSDDNSEEIIAADIQQLCSCVQEITGEVTPNDVLESIFSRFCIGK